VYDELKQLDLHKSEMFATVAHELKNPLTAITGHVELLDLSDVLRDDVAAGRSLSAIDRATNRLTNLVDDLLVLARLRDPHRPLAATDVDLVRVVREVADLLGAQAQKHDVRVRLDLDRTSCVRVSGETGELDRVVSNLVSNALKFSPSGTTVTVSLRRIGDSVVLSCADQGLGISEADQRQLFTEFFRSTNPTAQQVPGTGLGLAIVHRVVTRHGGTVAVQSAMGQGTTFTVTLPAATPTAQPHVA
jgi:signal transduction histidine kinase